MGLTTRRMADAKLSEWTETQAVPVVAVAAPDTHGQSTTLRSARPAGGLFPGADLCARQRLPEGLEGRHRRVGQSRRSARRNRRTRSRPADHAGQAELASAQANATLSQATLQRGQHLISIGRRIEAGSRTSGGRCLQQARVGQFGASQSRPPARAGEIQAHHRAIRRARDRAQHRPRCADQCRAGGGPPLFVVSDTSRLRVYVNVPQNYVPSIRIGTKAHISVPEYPGTRILGDGRSFRAVRRRCIRHDADAAHGR